MGPTATLRCDSEGVIGGDISVCVEMVETLLLDTEALEALLLVQASDVRDELGAEDVKDDLAHGASVVSMCMNGSFTLTSFKS